MQVRLEIDVQKLMQGEDAKDDAVCEDILQISTEDAKRIGEYAAANVTVGQ